MSNANLFQSTEFIPDYPTNYPTSYPTAPPAATPVPQSPTLSLAARQVAVSVISITDNVARIKIGNKFYDADITENMPNSAGSMVNKKLTITQEIAQKVQEHFQDLLANGVFTEDTKEITLSGDPRFNFTDIKTIDSAGVTTSKKITELAQNAQEFVSELKRYLKSQENALQTVVPLNSQASNPVVQPPSSRSESGPPSQATTTSPMAPTNTTSPMAPTNTTPPVAPTNTTSPVAPTNTTPPVAPTNTTSPVAPTATNLTTQFLKRSCENDSNPAAYINNQLYQSADPQFHIKAAKALAKHLTEGISHDDGFAQDTAKLALIKKELQRLATNDKTSLQDAGRDVQNGWIGFRKEAFIPGFIGNMQSNQFDSYDAKDLVKLYASYLRKKGISDKMGEGFYEIFVQFANDRSNATKFRRALQIRILGKNGSEIKEKAMYPKDQGLVPGNCIYLLQEGEGSAAKFKAYKREQINLKSLDDFTDTAAGPVAAQLPTGRAIEHPIIS